MNTLIIFLIVHYNKTGKIVMWLNYLCALTALSYTLVSRRNYNKKRYVGRHLM